MLTEISWHDKVNYFKDFVCGSVLLKYIANNSKIIVAFL